MIQNTYQKIKRDDKSDHRWNKITADIIKTDMKKLIIEIITRTVSAMMIWVSVNPWLESEDITGELLIKRFQVHRGTIRVNLETEWSDAANAPMTLSADSRCSRSY